MIELDKDVLLDKLIDLLRTYGIIEIKRLDDKGYLLRYKEDEPVFYRAKLETKKEGINFNKVRESHHGV